MKSAPDPDSGRVRKPETTRVNMAYAVYRLQELVTPVDAIIEYAGAMIDGVRDTSHARFIDDLEKIKLSGSTLRERLVNVLMAAKTTEADDPRQVLEVITPEQRHDLRTPLNHIIGYAEMLLEDAREIGAPAVEGDLAKVLDWGRQLLALLDAVKSGMKTTTSDPPSGKSHTSIQRMVKDVISTVKPVGDRVREHAEALHGRILVADDNELSRDVLCRSLERQGHETAQASTGEGVLRALQSERFDLVLLDVMMPDLNGLDVLRVMRTDQDLRRIPVIMISALAETDTLARCIDAGAEDFLQKPPDPVLLAARIQPSLEKKRLLDRERQLMQEVQKERRRSDNLLKVILPEAVIAELKEERAVKPRRHENVAVLFTDIVGFTSYCDDRQPEDVVPILQELTEGFEQLVEQHGLLKIKTVGDAFMATAGLLVPCEAPVRACVEFGLSSLALARKVAPDWALRVGIHSGPVVAGVLGKRQFSFDLWGDTVNVAARMESVAEPGGITVSTDAWKSIDDEASGDQRTVSAVKGKGEMTVFDFRTFTQ